MVLPLWKIRKNDEIVGERVGFNDAYKLAANIAASSVSDKERTTFKIEYTNRIIVITTSPGQ